MNAGRTLFLTLLGALAALLPGCGTTPRPATALPIPSGRYAEAFDAAREALRDLRFDLERVDARLGVITSRPHATDGLATPWDLDQTSSRQEVQDLMHQGIIGCSPDDTVAHAAEIMIEADIHAVVVMDGGRAVGVMSQTDLVLASQDRTRDDARALPVREVMTEGCLTCEAGTLLSEAVSLMTSRRMHRLVVTADGEPVGVLSMTDVVRKLLS